MLPPDTVARAGLIWLRLLRSSTVNQGWALIHANPEYADLTITQYALGLDWITELGVVTNGSSGRELSPLLRSFPQESVMTLIFGRAIELAAPAWLPDADTLLLDGDDLPQDAAALADVLGVQPERAFDSVMNICGKIDLARRSEIGLAGEMAVIDLLERTWPGSTTHVALSHDGFGYDALFRIGEKEWHLEIKSTTRRGRLTIFLSRHEHEVSLRDPTWRLVVVGLDHHLKLNTIVTVRHDVLLERAPSDQCKESSWKSVSHDLTPTELENGLSFLDPTSTLLLRKTIEGRTRIEEGTLTFGWAPSD